MCLRDVRIKERIAVGNVPKKILSLSYEIQTLNYNIIYTSSRTITGGSFLEGAAIGLAVTGFNHLMHPRLDGGSKQYNDSGGKYEDCPNCDLYNPANSPDDKRSVMKQVLGFDNNDLKFNINRKNIVDVFWRNSNRKIGYFTTEINVIGNDINPNLLKGEMSFNYTADKNNSTNGSIMGLVYLSNKTNAAFTFGLNNGLFDGFHADSQYLVNNLYLTSLHFNLSPVCIGNYEIYRKHNENINIWIDQFR
jgi:hypothetical protein